MGLEGWTGPGRNDRRCFGSGTGCCKSLQSWVCDAQVPWQANVFPPPFASDSTLASRWKAFCSAAHGGGAFRSRGQRRVFLDDGRRDPLQNFVLTQQQAQHCLGLLGDQVPPRFGRRTACGENMRTAGALARGVEKCVCVYAQGCVRLLTKNRCWFLSLSTLLKKPDGSFPPPGLRKHVHKRGRRGDALRCVLQAGLQLFRSKHGAPRSKTGAASREGWRVPAAALGDFII